MSLPHTRIALVGNPNSGKSSLFNRLTGLRQRTGNFPGVTVEHLSGRLALGEDIVELTDLPGTYSLHPSSLDERIVLEVLLGWIPKVQPEVLLYVADINKLDKHLLLLSQVLDLGYSTVVALNFSDERLADTGTHVDIESLSEQLHVPIVAVSARSGEGIDQLKNELQRAIYGELPPAHMGQFFELSAQEKRLVAAVPVHFKGLSEFGKLLAIHHAPDHLLSRDQLDLIEHADTDTPFNSMGSQVRETMQRYDRFLPTLRAATQRDTDDSFSDRVDQVVTHPFFGPLIFIVVLLLVFQAIFVWSSVPMDLIEMAFAKTGGLVRQVLPQGYISDFLVDGLLAGLAGIAVFVPQIALLFFLLTLLEEVGYMARAVFLSDRFMQRFGLNGRSLVALTASGACAIPAIMSARTIANQKERLITILVAPLISCSARIPVYAILIGFAVPAITVWGIFNAQALAFVGIYLVSAMSALLAALVFKWYLPDSERSYLMMELPAYRLPVWRNVWTTVWIKTRAFLFGAGKIIIAISLVLWLAASFGPGDSMDIAENNAQAQASADGFSDLQIGDFIANARLEASYAGHLGRFIEPSISPLGYDWKIGIALISSFAAREVFVGTIATLYAIGSTDDQVQITERLSEARRPDGSAVYNSATAASLIIFYLFAMQCMSTLAVTKRETGTWKWPLVQLVYMTVLAYVSALGVYQLFS